MAGYAGFTMANEILDFFYRGVAISIDGSLWIRFLVEPPSRAGGGTETNYVNYARYEIVRGSSLFGVSPANGRLASTVEIALPSASSAGNGILNAFDIVDTPSGTFSKVYNGGPISPPRAVEVGKPPKFRIGALVITF